METIPFHPKFHENQSKARNKVSEFPCAICGKGVDTAKEGCKFIYTAYGSEMCTKEEFEGLGDAWAMPVGPDCWRKHPEIHQYKVVA